ncbi:uncharacterized protein LOC135945823 isoform X1 [Cloeon dipterum]|uniref:uncharacterized protein LOC135945823 isoform X1 n=2 Tax=Cloeon dipterum TaxID=197152 RepID=UPI00321FEE32
MALRPNLRFGRRIAEISVARSVFGGELLQVAARGTRRHEPISSGASARTNSMQQLSPLASELATRLRRLLAKCEKAGVPPASVASLTAARKLRAAAFSRSGCKWPPLRATCVAGAIFICCVGWFTGLLLTPAVVSTYLSWWGGSIQDEKCLLANPDWLQDSTRPPEDCSICAGVDTVDRVSQISPQLFEQKYAYSGRPVVIEDAMRNWTAPSIFSLDFLRSLYRDSPQPNCQFFPYKTEFRGLADFFNMSEERATGKPWYVGWSNCDDRVSRQLRQYYSRPYFLPENSENKQMDWIFIGSPGYGAHMHVDNVGSVSWQAQLKGRKLWVLQPPPECLYRCSIMQTTLEPGDIIVLDTDRWYHSTLIVSDDISITIGAEFD